MKKLLVTFLLTILSFITYSQSGVGYVNYTSYKTHNGNGSTNQYPQFANNATEFDFLLNTANSNTTITHTGEVTLATMCNGSTGTPHWGGDFYAIKFEFWFIPTETGSYRFGINSDDASDISVDGTIISTYYGGHGAGGYQYGSKSMVAGTRYKIVARYQEYGGGDALYVRWSRPSAPNSYSYWNEEVTNINSTPTKKAVANFNLNGNLTATTFSVGTALSSAGLVDITNGLDSNKVSNGNYKVSTTPGQVEWIWAQAPGGNVTHIGIDLRKFNGVNPSTITSIQFLDGYTGPMTYLNSDDGTWARYDIPSDCNVLFGYGSNGYIGTSQYLSSIRNMGGAYMWGLSIEPTFTQSTAYKQQSISVTTTNTISTLYNSIVTVSDVYLAFKELANGGIFGNQSGNEFGYGIQYKNADINDDGYFNEADCFALLQNLTGAKTLVDTFNLNKTMRIIPQTKYDSIGKSNWTTFTTPLGSSYSFDINTGKASDTINLTMAWKGDVNLSHSTTPKSNGITTMSIKTMNVISTDINASIMTEVVADSIYAYITLDPLGQNVVGTQFQLNYDNSVLKFKGIQFTTKGSPTNYATDKGAYINLGSLISDGSTSLDNTTTYKISFSSNTKLNNILGLISIGSTDAVNKDGKTLKIKIN
jgi:hypothetical protein